MYRCVYYMETGTTLKMTVPNLIWSVQQVSNNEVEEYKYVSGGIEAKEYFEGSRWIVLEVFTNQSLIVP